DVVVLLKQLHALPKPDLPQGELDPFVRLVERIDAAITISDDDRLWLKGRLEDLKEQWASRPKGLPECVVHGDAWVGNVARTEAGPMLLDFERASFGPPEWDLVSTAVKLTTTGAVSAEEYAAFCETYGADVTEWEGYELLAGARELRMTTYAAQHAASRPARTEAGPMLLDFERASFGPPEWDLVSTAVKLTTTGAVSAEEYAAFCETYGADVTEWEGYELLAGARELRMTTYAAQHAASR